MKLPGNAAVLKNMLAARLAQAAPRCAPLAASLGRMLPRHQLMLAVVPVSNLPSQTSQPLVREIS